MIRIFIIRVTVRVAVKIIKAGLDVVCTDGLVGAGQGLTGIVPSGWHYGVKASRIPVVR